MAFIEPMHRNKPNITYLHSTRKFEETFEFQSFTYLMTLTMTKYVFLFLIIVMNFLNHLDHTAKLFSYFLHNNQHSYLKYHQFLTNFRCIAYDIKSPNNFHLHIFALIFCEDLTKPKLFRHKDVAMRTTPQNPAWIFYNARSDWNFRLLKYCFVVYQNQLILDILTFNSLRPSEVYMCR